MLYNPAWRDPAPLTLPKLIAWLERQPPDQAYNYACHGECLLATYAKKCGYPQAFFGGFQWYPDGIGPSLDIPPDIAMLAASCRTYGQALKSARLKMAFTKAKMMLTKESAS